MATTTPTASRRAVLGALAIIPVIAALPAQAIASADATRFNRRLATYRRLKDAQEAFYAANVVPLDEAHNRMVRDTPEWRAGYEAVCAAEAVHDGYVDRMSQACDVMLLTPAPLALARREAINRVGKGVGSECRCVKDGYA